MRNKKIQGQNLFQICQQKQNGSLKSKDGRKSPRKKISPKGKRRLNFPSKKHGLLFGKRFYLDLIGQGKLKSIQSKIVDLGGSVEEFWSKEVYCIITDRVTVEEVIASNKKGTPMIAVGPNPSPLQQLSSNKCYGNSPMSTDSPQSLEARTLNATRGKTFLKHVAATQRQGSTNLLENARKWNVKVMHYDQFVNWSKDKLSQCKRSYNVEKQPSRSFQPHSSFRVKSLKSPFIKIEEQNRNYRPFYLEMTEWPILHFDSAPGNCPFEKPKKKKDLTGNYDQMSDKETNKDESSQNISDKVSESPKDKKDDVKGGYCECCKVRFTSLTQHLKGDQHRTYATNEANYTELDAIISRGNSFEQFLDAVSKRVESQRSDNAKNEESRLMSCDSNSNCISENAAVNTGTTSAAVIEGRKIETSPGHLGCDQLEKGTLLDYVNVRTDSNRVELEAVSSQLNHEAVRDNVNPGTTFDQANRKLEATGGHHNDPQLTYNQIKMLPKAVCNHNEPGSIREQMRFLPVAACDNNDLEPVCDATTLSLGPMNDQNQPELSCDKTRILPDAKMPPGSVCDHSEPEVHQTKLPDSANLEQAGDQTCQLQETTICDKNEHEFVCDQNKVSPEAIHDQIEPKPACDQTKLSAEAISDQNDYEFVCDPTKVSPEAVHDQNEPEPACDQTKLSPEAIIDQNVPEAICDPTKVSTEAIHNQSEPGPSCDQTKLSAEAISDQTDLKLVCNENELQPVVFQNNQNEPEPANDQSELELSCNQSKLSLHAICAKADPELVCDQTKQLPEDKCDQNESEIACDQTMAMKEAAPADNICDRNETAANHDQSDAETFSDQDEPGAAFNKIEQENICDQIHPIAFCDERKLVHLSTSSVPDHCDVFQKSEQPTKRFTRSTLTKNSATKSSFFAPLQRILRSASVGTGSPTGASSHRYPKRFKMKPQSMDNVDVNSHNNIGDIDIDVDVNTDFSGSSTLSDDEKQVFKSKFKDPKFSGSSTIGLPSPDRGSDYTDDDDVTIGLDRTLTMTHIDEKTHQTLQIIPDNHGKRDRVNVPTDVLITQPKQSPDVPTRRNSKANFSVDFSSDKSCELEQDCSSKVNNILCFLESPMRTMENGEHSADFKSKKTPVNVSLEEGATATEDNANENGEHEVKQRHEKRKRLNKKMGGKSRKQSKRIGVQETLAVSTSLETSIPAIENKENVFSNLDMNHSPKRSKRVKEKVGKRNRKQSKHTYIEAYDNKSTSDLWTPDDDELDARLPNIDSCSSITENMDDVFFDDFKKGISLHERIKTRKRQASLVATMRCEEHLTPTKKRRTFTENQPCSQSSVLSEADHNIEEFPDILSNKDKRSTRGDIQLYPAIYASSPTKAMMISSPMRSKQFINAVGIRTAPQKVKQLAENSVIKQTDTPITVIDTSIDSKTANSSLLTDSSSSLNTSNPVVLSISSALLSSKRAQSKKKLSVNKISQAARNKIVIQAKKPSTKKAVISSSRERKSKKYFEFVEDGYDFDEF